MKIVVEEACRECGGRGSPAGLPLDKCRHCNGRAVRQRAIPLAELAALLRDPANEYAYVIVPKKGPGS